MEEPIQLLIVDDKKIIRDGLVGALSDRVEFQINQATTQAILSGKTPQETPSVILMKVDPVSVPHFEEIFRQLKRAFPLVKILVISLQKDILVDGPEHLIDIILQPPIIPDKLADIIIGLFHDDEHLCEVYDKSLKDLHPGKEDAYRYEILMGFIMKLLFKDHLIHSKAQSSTLSGVERRDFIFFNCSTHPFWVSLRTLYHGDQVVIELKNTKIINEHIAQIMVYMEPPMGRFGLLIGRSISQRGPRAKQVEAYRADKIILVLNDDDVHIMLAFKAAGVEPTDYLQLLFEALVRDI